MKRKAYKFIAIGIVALLFSLGVIHAAPDAPGDLDPGFGNGGKVTTDILGSGDTVRGIAIQTDGKIVAAGDAGLDFGLVRYNPDGSLDTTFGSGGKVTTDFSGSNDSARAVAIQTDGKIVLAGLARLGNNDFGLARYNTNGSLDTSFGTGGKVTTDFSGHNDQANSITLQADGKILVAGPSDTTGSGTLVFALVRYNTDGSLDATFGSGGKVTTAFPSTSIASGVAVQVDGEIVVAGYTTQIPSDFALARYDTNGSLDPTFGSGGKVTTDLFGFNDVAYAIAIQSDGGIVLAGYTAKASGAGQNDFALARYDKVGNLDPSFGSGGKVTADFLGNNDFGTCMDIQLDGKIVMAGSVTTNGTLANDFGLARFNKDGSLDTAFGSGGKVTTDFFGNLENAQGMTIQADGKIVVAGFADSASSRDFALARYQAAPPTAITLASFKATAYDTGVYLEWQTGFESDNLGFNLYRDEAGKRTLVNQQLVAGSALRASSTLRSGETYAWWDECKSKDAVYWLEDLDLNGQSTWHGPFSIKQVGGAPPSRRSTAPLSQLGNRQSESEATRSVERVATVSRTTAEQDQSQSWLARQRAVKISVKHEGWYRVTQPELVRAGLDAKLNPRTLQLFVDGIEQSIFVDSPGDGSFDTSSAIEFYGYGLDTASTDARVYWLYVGDKEGKRIARSKGTGVPFSSSSFNHTVERRDRTIYFSALLNGERENFFGTVIASAPVDQPLALTHVNSSASKPATLEVNLQGVTSLAHRVSVHLNDSYLGEITFTGKQQGAGMFSVPPASLREGENTVRLIPQAGAGDVSLVDHLRLSYQHTFAADDDALKFAATGKQRVTVDGFSSNRIRVFDVTDADNVRELIGEVSQSRSGFAVTVAPRDSGLRTLIALTEEKRQQPASLEANRPSSWRNPANAADFVIITSADLLTAMQPLKGLRQAEGYKTALIDVEDLYDEFNFGHKSPQAIKDFLAYAKTNWRVRPRFLLFAGDASFDPKNYLGLGDNDMVPTKLIDTNFLETASDDWFGDFNGDGISDVAVGRLPVRNAEEAAVIVSKLVRYLRSEPSESALLVSDANDGFNFEEASRQLRPVFPSSLKVDEIKRGELDQVTAKTRLFEAINQGQKFVNYVGHGNVNQWRGDLLTSADVSTLTNETRLPVFVMMNCLNGYFQDAALDSLAESLMKAERGGAIGVWASSGMTPPDQQTLMNRQFYRLLFSATKSSGKDNDTPTLGEAAQRAKSVVADADIRRTWILFGDPTTRLK